MGFSASQTKGGNTTHTTLTDSQNQIRTVTNAFDSSGNVGIYITPPSGFSQQGQANVDDSFAGLSGNSLLYIGIACLSVGALALLKKGG